jgi:hypothetical protein
MACYEGRAIARTEKAGLRSATTVPVWTQMIGVLTKTLAVWDNGVDRDGQQGGGRERDGKKMETRTRDDVDTGAAVAKRCRPRLHVCPHRRHIVNNVVSSPITTVAVANAGTTFSHTSPPLSTLSHTSINTLMPSSIAPLQLSTYDGHVCPHQNVVGTVATFTQATVARTITFAHDGCLHTLLVIVDVVINAGHYLCSYHSQRPCCRKISAGVCCLCPNQRRSCRRVRLNCCHVGTHTRSTICARVTHVATTFSPGAIVSVDYAVVVSERKH